jgi:phosphoribosylformylglycinamidine synthase
LKILLASPRPFAQHRAVISAVEPGSVRRLRIVWRMKAKIIITPKKAVLDPQGKTVQNALAHMGYEGVGAVHVGKYLEIELADGDKDAARQRLSDACHRFLSNPVIEDYRLEIE